ncbi:hypothetical protein B0J11DRAFT_67112 [Dendryphion nanum]|uniref:Domain of unknown function at the cortex 1 domain-containing protein n=1 Tax=Dendryphion nanum TaxID=256645 RepID=A0A9P9IHG3_9PLEO|nr:hypothetical protein B0J11DRAFT_67112 [Dendryphion nanum]
MSPPVIDPQARDKYRLQVSAGPTRDPSTHSIVAVNGPDVQVIDNEFMTAYLQVRIRDYNGLPESSPPSADYFNHPDHTSDRYSVAFSFVPKVDIPGQDLVTGFDFDHPIRDRLPPGFKYAMKIVTTIVDPGIYSDPYSDNPYLYGPGLSSFFAFHIGEHISQESLESQLQTFAQDDNNIISEGASGSGQRIRADQHIPSKTSKRRKYFLNASNLANFTFEKDRLYQADFFNPYLDFANFAVRIPGFSISIAKYIDDKTHQLRYVMKNRATEEVYMCVVFTLLFGQMLEETLGSLETPPPQSQATITEDEMERGRRTSSSYETPASSSRSSSARTEDSVERAERQTAATSLASSIYSSFAMLGFGRTASSNESSVDSSQVASKETSPERPKKESLDRKVDEMSAGKVENFLQSKHGNIAV